MFRAGKLAVAGWMMGAALAAQAAPKVEYSVRTEARPAMQGEFWVSGGKWSCPPRLMRCSGPMPADMAPLEACQRVVAWVGSAREFKGPQGGFDARRLEQCNEAAGAGHAVSRGEQTASPPAQPEAPRATTANGPVRVEPQAGAASAGARVQVTPADAPPVVVAPASPAAIPQWRTVRLDLPACRNAHPVIMRATLHATVQLPESAARAPLRLALYLDGRLSRRWSIDRPSGAHGAPVLPVRETLELRGDRGRSTLQIEVDGLRSPGHTLDYACVGRAPAVVQPR